MAGGVVALFTSAGLVACIFHFHARSTARGQSAASGGAGTWKLVDDADIQTEEAAPVEGVLAAACSEAKTTDDLIKCAEDTLSLYASGIASNLQSQGIDKIDLAWPGTGFNQAAYGGQWQVLVALENRCDFRVENVVGSSGGASSAVLALGDPHRSAKTMMDIVMGAGWGWVTTSEEYATYKLLLEVGGGGTAMEHAYASMKCNSNSNVIDIVYDFKDVDQAAKAFAASGDVWSSIFGDGYSLGGNLSYCHDGGDLMGIGQNPLLYYNTFYGHTTGCDRACAIELFMKGVGATINTLLSGDLRTIPAHSQGGAIAIQKPKGGTWTLSQFRDKLMNGGFWEILTNSGDQTKRVFVRGKSLT